MLLHVFHIDVKLKLNTTLMIMFNRALIT